MNGFLVSVWGGDVKAVRLFSERAEAKAYLAELEAHYKLGEVDTWRGDRASHHPDVIAAERHSPGEVGREMANYWITEFRDGRPVA